MQIMVESRIESRSNENRNEQATVMFSFKFWIPEKFEGLENHLKLRDEIKNLCKV